MYNIQQSKYSLSQKKKEKKEKSAPIFGLSSNTLKCKQEQKIIVFLSVVISHAYKKHITFVKYPHETWSSPWKSTKLVQYPHRQDQNQHSVGKAGRLGRSERVYCHGPYAYRFRWSCQESKTPAMATWFWGINRDLVCCWVHWIVFACICDFKRFP